MSTTTYARPLHTVPDIPTTKAKFAALLYLRNKAQHAFDQAISLPRSAIRWAVSLLQRWTETMASIGVFSWLGQQARKATGIIQSAGIIPVAVAVLSTPPIAAAATRLAQLVGNGVRRMGTSIWTGLKSLLARCGSTGAKVSQGLSHAGAKVADSLKAAAQHPVMAPITQALRATAALVRPISQGLVAHRLLSAMVPILWLRTLVGFLVMPLLIDRAMIGDVSEPVSTPPADPTPKASRGKSNGVGGKGDNLASNNVSDTSTALFMDAFEPATEVPMPTSGSLLTGDTDDDDASMNRAERRAQQRHDAQAKRPRR